MVYGTQKTIVTGANLNQLLSWGPHIVEKKIRHIPMTDPNGAAIYAVPWIPSTKTPFMLAYIPYMDPMGIYICICICICICIIYMWILNIRYQ